MISHLFVVVFIAAHVPLASHDLGGVEAGAEAAVAGGDGSGLKGKKA